LSIIEGVRAMRLEIPVKEKVKGFGDKTYLVGLQDGLCCGTLKSRSKNSFKQSFLQADRIAGV
jgi:hypothetical protein